MITATEPALVLCRVSLRNAQHLGMAASAAGGWIATCHACRYVYVVDAPRGAPSYAPEFVALLPWNWSAACNPLKRRDAEDIAARLERAGEPVPADFAARIRQHLAGGEARAAV